MHAVGLFFSLGLLAIVGYIVVTFYMDFRGEAGTTWQRLIAAAENSATILWAKFCLVVAALTAQIDSLCDMLGAPEAKDFINAWVGNPKMIAALMLAIASVSIMARKRSL